MNHYKQLIKQYFYKKRLSNEFIKLIENKVINYQEMDNQLHLFIVDNSLSIFNKIIITKNDHSYINYIEFFTNDNIIRYIKCTFTDMYPFKPPNIIINHNNYVSLLHFNIKHLKLLKLNESYCFCCESITCTDKWYPTFNIYKLLMEINKNIKYKMDYTYNICVNVIKRKYLNPDIPIMDFILDIPIY